MMKIISKRILAAAGIGLLAGFPGISYAGEFVAKEQSAQTTGDVNDDLYIAGDSVSVDHSIRDDLYSAGNSVDVTGDVGEDVWAAGNTVRVTGMIGDDVWAAGNTVRVTPKEVGDVFAAGSTVEIDSDKIEGSIYAAGQTVSISGKIGGSVRATGGQVKIKSGSEIQGDLVTYGKQEPLIEEGVMISGETKHIFDDTHRATAATGTGLMLGWLTNIVVWMITALVVLYLWSGLTKDTISNALHRGGRSLGVGFVWVIALVPVVLILMATVIGWPLAIVILLGSGVAVVIANAMSMIVVGVWVMEKIQKKATAITWRQVVVGTVSVKLIQLVPQIGWVISLVIMLLTLGAVGISVWQRLSVKSLHLNKIDAVSDKTENKEYI